MNSVFFMFAGASVCLALANASWSHRADWFLLRVIAVVVLVALGLKIIRFASKHEDRRGVFIGVTVAISAVLGLVDSLNVFASQASMQEFVTNPWTTPSFSVPLVLSILVQSAWSWSLLLWSMPKTRSATRRVNVFWALLAWCHPLGVALGVVGAWTGWLAIMGAPGGSIGMLPFFKYREPILIASAALIIASLPTWSHFVHALTPRVKLGTCHECGYPLLHPNARCSECGVQASTPSQFGALRL